MTNPPDPPSMEAPSLTPLTDAVTFRVQVYADDDPEGEIVEQPVVDAVLAQRFERRIAELEQANAALQRERDNAVEMVELHEQNIGLLNKIIIDTGHRAKSAESELALLRKALEEIGCCHDGNQPAALNMPELDYARRVIRNMHRIASDALKGTK